MNIPDFPSAIGEAASIEFTKDGQEYRMLRVDEDTVVIHKRDSTQEQFERVVTHFSADRSMFDVFGTGQIGGVTGYGADRTILHRLF